MLFRPRLPAPPLLALCALLSAVSGAVRAADPPPSDYPTVERVLFVQECMRAHPGSYFEMVNKCSCAIDALARELPFDDYSTLSTVANALTIGGERGAALRDNEAMAPMARKFRDLQVKVKRGCFINTDAAPATR